MMDLSIILPAHQEAENLPKLLEEILSVVEGLELSTEILVIDDGSTDATPDLMKYWMARDSRIRGLRLDRNYGQSAALDAGLRNARGNICVTLDADGQNPPADIPKLLEALHNADMVCGWRLGRKDHWTKYWASKFANTVRRWVLNDGIHDSGCCFRAFRQEAVSRIKLFHGMHRFLPVLVRMEGYRVTEVRVQHRPRLGGKTHYGIFNRLWGPLIDMLVVAWMQHRCRAWKLSEPPTCQESTRFPESAAVSLKNSPSRVGLVSDSITLLS